MARSGIWASVLVVGVAGLAWGCLSHDGAPAGETMGFVLLAHPSVAMGADPHTGGDAISTAIGGAAGRIRSCLSFRAGSWAFSIVGQVVVVAVSRPTWAASVPPT